jgi:hypothetical protein
VKVKESVNGRGREWRRTRREGRGCVSGRRGEKEASEGWTSKRVRLQGWKGGDETGRTEQEEEMERVRDRNATERGVEQSARQSWVGRAEAERVVRTGET